jgi:hypothetical protein
MLAAEAVFTAPQFRTSLEFFEVLDRIHSRCRAADPNRRV